MPKMVRRNVANENSRDIPLPGVIVGLLEWEVGARNREWGQGLF